MVVVATCEYCRALKLYLERSLYALRAFSKLYRCAIAFSSPVMNVVFERTTETCVAAGYYQVLLPPNYFESSQTGPMTSVLPSASSHINGSGSRIVARLLICTAEIAFMAHGIAQERCVLEPVPSSSCLENTTGKQARNLAPQRFPFTFFGCRLVHVKSSTLFEESRTLV